jgi:hypothetical protein
MKVDLYRNTSRYLSAEILPRRSLASRIILEVEMNEPSLMSNEDRPLAQHLAPTSAPKSSHSGPSVSPRDLPRRGASPEKERAFTDVEWESSSSASPRANLCVEI